MALPMLRGCYCNFSRQHPSVLTLTRVFGPRGGVLVPSQQQVRLAGPGPVCGAGPVRGAGVSFVRTYCDRGGGQNNKQFNLKFVGIPNPFIWFRTRIYYFLIRAYFDKEFSIHEFTDGAKQAFTHVSRLLSQCQIDALEGLIAKDLGGKLKEKCALLPESHKAALLADHKDIMYTTPLDVGIYYDDDGGRKFVSILMCFWYLTSARLCEDDTVKGVPMFKVASRDGEALVLTAKYEFQREFTKGVTPEWIITRIEHSTTLLD